MITIARTRTLRALRDALTQAEEAAEAARATAEQHRQDAQRTTDSAIRAETALETLRAKHAALVADAARDAGELEALRAQQLLDTEDRAVLRLLLRTTRKTISEQQRVFVLLRRGAFHSVHGTREAAEKAAERDGAHPDGWFTQGSPGTDCPATDVLWRIQPTDIGTGSQ
ncbi:hypothetical protein [Streptomyces hirsutus]|uniref:hypothetical protein n=1 Tax=Streptomyces hirsutus TaxID=35620 RepID=UPI003669FCB2